VLASQVRHVFELAAARLTDRQVAEQTELGLYVVRGMLTNPLYAGRLRDGRTTAFPPLVPPSLFEQVQAIRDVRRTRDRRPAIRRHYALSMLRCAACRKRLIGDTGRYRHPDPCADFVAAGGVSRPRRGRHSHGASFSYRAAEYEAVVTSFLAEIELGADVLAEVMVSAPEAPAAARMALARIEREREAVLDRYRRTRDTAELETAMARLDADENGARAMSSEDVLTPAERLAYLRNLPALWADAPNSRRAIAESLFERIEVVGLQRVHLEPTAAAVARGVGEAFSARNSGYGRGERGCPLVTHAAPRFRMINSTPR